MLSASPLQKLSNVFVLLTFFFRVGFCHEGHSFETSLDKFTFGDLYEVRDVAMVDSQSAHPAHIQRRRLPMGRELTFTAVGKEFDFKIDLTLELTEVYGYKATIYGALADGVEPHDRSYRGQGFLEKCTKDGECEFYGEVTKASVTFFETFGEHVFHALIRLDKEEFAVDPKRFVDKEKFLNGASFPSSDSPLTEIEADMYFYSSTNVFEKAMSEDTGDIMFLPKRRLLQQVTVFTNCYAGQGQATYRISMGMLIDNGFYAVTGGNSAAVRDYVTGMMNDMNTMYSAQMGVEIALQNLVLGDTTGFNTNTFNEAPTTPGTKTCPSGKQPSTRLNELRIWRQTYHSNNMGLWHLMTHCHPPSGTVGIAYVGALCHSFGVGLSNYLGSSTWEVLAHEVGHNFGSGHTFDMGVSGGIMDYGDGLLNGVYQFHPVHKDEVCSEISSSMTRTRSITQCWAASTTPTPNPVAAPTPRPTAPTPQPTAPTPRPTQVIPTPRPTQTPRPTLSPTPRPTVQTGGTVYQWEERTGVYGDCSASCGPGFETQVVECRRYDLGTCSINYATADLGTCTDDDFSNCDYTVVNNALCSIGCKPTATTRTCNEGTCTNQCGNGILNKDEYCDTAIDTCCKNDCSGWKTGTNCAGTDPTVDAAVMDYDQRLYTFQGSQFSVYADMDSTAPLDGFPKAISTIEGLDAAWHNGIDSAASYYDDIVFLFRGLQFIVVDLGEMEAIGGVRDLDDYFTLTSQFTSCGSVDAVLSYYWTMDLICGEITAELSWQNRQMSASELVADKWNAGWPANIAPGQLSAVVRNPITGHIRFYQGSYTSTWAEGSTTPTVTKAQAFGLDAAQCIVENCQQCRADMQRCTTCNPGYRRKRGGRLCKPPKNFVDMSFDDNDYTTALMEYTMGSNVASADNGGWDIMGEIVEGAFGYGLQLDGQSMTRLQPHDFGEPVDHWKVSFWWKPDQLTRQRFLTLNRDRGNGYNEMFTIDFVHESETEVIGANNLGIEIWMYDQRIDCYVDNPITKDDWNKISIEFNRGEIVTSANGVAHKVQMNTGNTDDYAVEFKDWYIGERSNHAQGVTGVIDKFEVANLNIGDEAPNSGSTPTWVIVILVIGILLALGFCGYMFYRFYYVKKLRSSTTTPGLEEEIQEDLPKAPSSSGSEVRQIPTGMIQTSGGPRAPPRPKKTPPRMPPRPAGKAGKRPPPRKGAKAVGPPPPPIAARGRGLDLGKTPEERRASWRV